MNIQLIISTSSYWIEPYYTTRFYISKHFIKNWKIKNLFIDFFENIKLITGNDILARQHGSFDKSNTVNQGRFHFESVLLIAIAPKKEIGFIENILEKTGIIPDQTISLVIHDDNLEVFQAFIKHSPEIIIESLISDVIGVGSFIKYNDREWNRKNKDPSKKSGNWTWFIIKNSLNKTYAIEKLWKLNQQSSIHKTLES